MLANRTKGVCRLLGAVCLGSLLAPIYPAMADQFWETYMPPELAFSDDLRQSVTVPARININKDSYNQLLALPGFDEDIALKVLRNRPFEGVQDFYRKMPSLGKKNIDRLIQQVQPKILFK